VVILYVWTAVFAFGTAALVRFPVRVVGAGLAVASAVALIATLGPLRSRGRFLDDTMPLPVVAPCAGPPSHPRQPRKDDL
jgi:UDP-GlcNAc:undecaprenyl-phosphate GlcNAc-1-phosphate transferase